MKSFKQFQEEFNKPKYSEKQMKVALEAQDKALHVNRVIEVRHDNSRIARQIVGVYKTSEGIVVMIR
jgi:hypothetical protein